MFWVPQAAKQQWVSGRFPSEGLVMCTGVYKIQRNAHLKTKIVPEKTKCIKTN